MSMNAYEVGLSEDRYVGRIIIISMEEKAEPEREGGQIDRDNLREFLQDRNFEVIELVDKDEDTIFRNLQRLSSEPVANYDIFMCVIMAHGGYKNGYFQVARDKQMSIEVVMNYFGTKNCPALFDKPKIFLINTCRGGEDGHSDKTVHNVNEADSGNSLSNFINTIRSDISRLSSSGSHESVSPSLSGSEDPENSSSSSSPSPIKATNLAFLHTIVAFSTLKNYISWRNKERGTVFIFSLLEVLTEFYGTMDLRRILQETSKRVMEYSKNGQAIEYRELACHQEIYLVPNTSVDIKKWLLLGCGDRDAVMLMEGDVERQARQLFAKGYKDVRHLVRDSKIKFTSAASLESVGIDPSHTLYLFTRIHGTRFVPTVPGALAALQQITFLSELSHSFLKEDALMKIVDEAHRCLANCIVPYNLSAFSAHRQDLLGRIKDVLHFFIKDTPAVRDQLATHVCNLTNIAANTFTEGLTSDIAALTSASRGELILLFDKLAEIVFAILRTASSDNFDLATKAIATTSAVYVRRCFEALSMFPEYTQDMCAEYSSLEMDLGSAPNVTFLVTRENVLKIILSVLRNVDHHSYKSFMHLAVLGLTATCKLLAVARYIPITMDTGRTQCLQVLEQLMTRKIEAEDWDTNALCIQLIELIKNDALFVNTSQFIEEMNTSQLHKVNHNLMVRLIAVLRCQLSRNVGDSVISSLFNGLNAVIRSTHFNKPVSGGESENSPLDIASITQVMTTHSQHLSLAADGLNILALLFPYKIACTESVMISLFSSLLPLMRSCREDFGLIESKTRLTSIAFILKNCVYFLTMLRDVDPAQYTPALQESGLMREIIEVLMVAYQDSTNNPLVGRLMDLLPPCLSARNIAAFCATIEGEDFFRSFIHALLIPQLTARAASGAYGGQSTASEPETDNEQNACLVGHEYYQHDSSTSAQQSDYRADSFILSLHRIISYDREVTSSLGDVLSPAGHRRAILIDEYGSVAQLMVEVMDFKGMGLVARMSAQHAALLANCGAIRVILSTVRKYQYHVGMTPESALMVSARLRHMIAARMSYMCSALAAFSTHPGLIELMTDIGPLLMVIYTFISSKTYTPKTMTYISHYLAATMNIARHSAESRRELGDSGLCRVAIELFACYPDVNTIYALIVALAEDCPSNCERLTPLSTLIIDKLSADFKSVGGRRNQKKMQTFGLLKIPVPARSTPAVNSLVKSDGVMTFRVLQTLMRAESNRVACVEEDLFVHIVFVLDAMFVDKAKNFDERTALVTEILHCVRVACKTTESVRRLSEVDSNSGLLLVNVLRRCRYDIQDRDLFFAALGIAHVMVKEHKAVSKQNKDNLKKYVMDLVKFVNSCPPHPQAQSFLSKAAGMMV